MYQHTLVQHTKITKSQSPDRLIPVAIVSIIHSQNAVVERESLSHDKQVDQHMIYTHLNLL